MSDVTILEDDEPPEFRSPFDVEFDTTELEIFKWLVLGHVLYVVGLALTLLAGIPYGNVWMTPLFGIPLLWRERRAPRLWAKALVFVVGFTAIHYLALYAAQQYIAAGTYVPGLVGGLIGGAGALLLCALFGLLRPGAASLIFAAFGALMLGVVGSFGVGLYLTTGAADTSFAGALVQALKVYTPWQLVFAYMLSKELHRSA